SSSSLSEGSKETVDALITDSAHERMLKYAHGNPRDYLALFRKSYFKFYTSSSAKITSAIVDRAAKELGVEKLEIAKGSTGAKALLTKIVKFVLHDKQLSAFFVKVDQMADLDILFLIHAR